MTIYKYELKCKACEKAVVIMEIYFTKGTIIVLEVLCPNCNLHETHQADFFLIQSEIHRRLGIIPSREGECIQ